METAQGFRRKCKRYNTEGHAHEFTFSCYKTQRFLLSDRIRQYFAESIVAAKESQSFHLWAYVLMPEHVHVIVRPYREEYSVSKILNSMKQPVSRRATNHLRRHNPEGLKELATGQKARPYRFWQPGGGYDRNIAGVPALQAAIEYIHANPVRRGLVESPTDWEWSSARAWSGDGEGPIPVDRESFMEILV